MYAPQGALSDVYLNGNHETFSFDNRLRLTVINVGSGSILNLAYGYLGNGDMSTITNNRDTGRNETFGYDQLNRLTTAQSQATSGADCWGQSIPSTGYDRYCNLLTIVSTQCSSPTLNLTVSTKNRVTNTNFTYDNAGNLTFDGLYNYTWDAENHLKSANGVSYTYDGGLRRVKKSNGKLYWYSTSGQILEETDLSGNVISDYVYFAGKQIARRDASGNVYFYFTDPLGTVRGIYTSGSSLCYDADFYPFGGEKVFTNTCAQNYKFTGLERDAESGLDKTVNRMYTSNMGRWLNPDRRGGLIGNPQSLNRYAYVLNNPTSLADPLGLDASSDDGCTWVNSNLTCPAPPPVPTDSGGGNSGDVTGSPDTGSGVAAGEPSPSGQPQDDPPPPPGPPRGCSPLRFISAALDQILNNPDCKAFIVNTIKKTFAYENAHSPQPVAQNALANQRSVTSAEFFANFLTTDLDFQFDPNLTNVVAETDPISNTMIFGPTYCNSSPKGKVETLIHEMFHTFNYFFLDTDIANAIGAPYTVVTQGPNAAAQTYRNADIAWDKELARHCRN